jgi:hypothetical protein
MRLTNVRDRLLTAKTRLAAATRGSPEWDAATAEVEDAEVHETFLARFDRMVEPEPDVATTPIKQKRSRSRRRR